MWPRSERTNGAPPPLPPYDEHQFLSGPKPRGSELRRLVRIGSEFLRGFRALHFVGPCVTVFGSARFSEEHRYYVLAREMGQHLAQDGFTVMTGGGPGVMEAANRGARDVGGISIGCNIKLPKEQRPNPYLDQMVEFHYFFVRKVMMVKYSYAFVALPGGFGTMDEIFETLTLIQTGKIGDFPLILMGTDYWRPLLDLIGKTMVNEKTIHERDLEDVVVTDSPEAAMTCLRDCVERRFGVGRGAPRARRLLGERKSRARPTP